MKVKFLLIFFIIFLIGCSSQEFGSLDFSDSAKEELQQLLQKSNILDTLDVIYNFHSDIAGQSLADIAFRNVKQGNKQRQEVSGSIFGFNLSAYTIINDGKQATCALFNNSWECGIGDEVCKATPKGKLCQSVSQEGIPPTINPEMLEKSKVAKTEQKQILGMQAQCYELLTTEGGNKALTEVCFNRDGIIMSIAINAKLFQAIFEAKSFSTSVQPELFYIANNNLLVTTQYLYISF